MGQVLDARVQFLSRQARNIAGIENEKERTEALSSLPDQYRDYLARTVEVIRSHSKKAP